MKRAQQFVEDKVNAEMLPLHLLKTILEKAGANVTPLKGVVESSIGRPK